MTGPRIVRSTHWAFRSPVAIRISPAPRIRADHPTCAVTLRLQATTSSGGSVIISPTMSSYVAPPGPLRLGILDDYQDTTRRIADWGRLPANVSVTVFNDHVQGDELIRRLISFDILVITRERTPFSRYLIERLPNLKLLVTTGARNLAIDLAACRYLDDEGDAAYLQVLLVVDAPALRSRRDRRSAPGDHLHRGDRRRQHHPERRLTTRTVHVGERYRRR